MDESQQQEWYKRGFKDAQEASNAVIAQLQNDLAAMTKNRDQWERNAAAENKRAGDTIVTLERMLDVLQPTRKMRR